MLPGYILTVKVLFNLMRDRIRVLREFLGLTRREFAERCGLKRDTIDNIEKGNQKVNEDHIEAITSQWPEFAYWLVTGKTLPESGQISPEIEETRKNLKGAG
jgi:transcriptional regulator with XRE-family HTH domain